MGADNASPVPRPNLPGGAAGHLACQIINVRIRTGPQILNGGTERPLTPGLPGD